MNKKYLKYGFFFIPVLIILVVMFSSKPKKTWEQEGRVTSPRGKTLEDWASGSFIPVTTDNDFKQKLAGIPISATNITLDSVQSDGLRESIHNFVMAYHVGSYEAYSKFRLPIPYASVDKRIIDFERLRLSALFPDKNWQSESAETIDREWWNYWDSRSTNAQLPAKGKGKVAQSYCTRCLSEVNLDSGKIVVSQEKNLPKQLNYYVTSFPNMGYTDWTPTFTFDPSPEKVVSKEGKIITAVVALVFKHEGDPPYPLFCRFYWISSKSTWVPMELAGALASKSLVYNF